MGGSSGGSTSTQVQQIPQWEQDYATQNQQIAASIASRPAPNYQGQVIADFTPQQNQSFDLASQAATAQQPYLDTANAMTQQGAQQWNDQTAQQYMSPYAMSALAPQIQQLQLQQNQQQQQTGSEATQAGAFGDARQGVAEGMNNFYSNLAMNDLVSQGMNTAYTTGQSAFQNDQSRMLGAGAQEAALGGQAQQADINGANALWTSGAQQQAQNQQQLTTSYDEFMNQYNAPLQSLNMRISALANSPYTQANYQTLAPPSGVGQAVGAFSSLAGALGVGGNSSGSSQFYGGSTSDRRLKKNISELGVKTKKHGLPLYKFHYVWQDDSEEMHAGVMAQDAIGVIPEAVVIDSMGYAKVDYRKVM